MLYISKKNMYNCVNDEDFKTFVDKRDSYQQCTASRSFNITRITLS